MEIWYRIAGDIKKGENIDVYLYVLLSCIAVVLNLLGVLKQDKVLSLTLAVLALVCVSGIQNRHKMVEALSDLKSNSKILNDLSMNSASRSKIEHEFPCDYISSIETAKELYLVGVHHSSFMNEHYQSLIKMIKNGGNLFVMISDPEGDAIRMTSMRFSDGGNHLQEQTRAQVNLDKFVELRRAYPNQVHIKTMDYLFEYSVTFVNPKLKEGKAYVQRYTFRKMGGAGKPKLTYTHADDGDWYHLIHSELNSYWKCGKPYPDNQQTIKTTITSKPKKADPHRKQ